MTQIDPTGQIYAGSEQPEILSQPDSYRGVAMRVAFLDGEPVIAFDGNGHVLFAPRNLQFVVVDTPPTYRAGSILESLNAARKALSLAHEQPGNG